MSTKFYAGQKDYIPKLNELDDAFQSAISAVNSSTILAKNVAGAGSVTLTNVEAGNGFLIFTGALTGNKTVEVPAATNKWVVFNRTTGNFTLTVKTASGSGVAVAQGKQRHLVCDGVNVTDAVTDLYGLTMDKSQVGLDNVDNTSDVNKPISTAQQAALDVKLDASTFSTFTSATFDKAMIRRADLGASVDLNTVKTVGFYHQPSSANASSGTNYPTPNSGFLIVYATNTGTDTTGVAQSYFCVNLNRVYTRTLISNVWTQWVETLTTGSGVYTPGGLSVDKSSTDLNVLKTAGFFKGDALTNAPDTGYWFVTVEVHNTTFVKQTVTAFGAAGASRPVYPVGTTFVRVLNSGVWGAWQSIGGGASGGNSDKVFYENDQTVSTSYTITTGRNAMTAGPISIADGVTVTIPDGSVWTIV